MAAKRLGVPLSPEGLPPVAKDAQGREPGFGWTLTDNAKRRIEDVEANLRTAEQRTGSIILR